MRQMVNGRVVDVPMDTDGAVDSDILRSTGGVPDDRVLILQLPGGGNQIVNPGEKVRVKPGEYFIDAPRHERGS